MSKWALALTVTLLGSSAVWAAPSTVSEISYLGQATFPTNTFYNNTQVGGLSGITYDPSLNIYYSNSDDRSQINPARFYTLTIDLSSGSLSDGKVVFTGVTTILDGNGQPFAAFSLDPEGIALVGGQVYISSEGEVSANRIINPFLNRFTLGGQQNQVLPIPAKFLPVGPIPTTVGVRNNLAFECVGATPDQTALYTCSENALTQDGPANSPTIGGLSRLLRFNLATGQPDREFLYRSEPVALPPIPAGSFATNGLVDVLAIDNEGTLLALERSFSTGYPGNVIKLYEISTNGATDISGIPSLNGVDTNSIVPVRKRLLFDLTTLGVPLDNLEGLTFGPTLPDGRRSLIIVSDNNFSSTQFTQFLAFGVRLSQRPVLQDVFPGNGYPGGKLTVIGANFTGASQVRLNGTPATFTVNADTNLTVTIPAGASSGALVVTTAQGTGTSEFNVKVNTRLWKSVGAANFSLDGNLVGVPVLVQGGYFYSYLPFTGPADILSRNGVTGENALWVMDQGAYQGAAPIAGVADPNWEIGATIDQVADASNPTKQYIFWRNRATGENAVWSMAGTSFLGATALPSVSNLDWEIVGTGQFNTDGQPDLLWRNRINGAVAVWLLSGPSYVSTTALLGVSDLNWELRGTGDFNGDGKADLLWRNRATGENAVWFMDGLNFLNSTLLLSVTDTNWEITGTSDFNGDFNVDLLWNNRATGENAVWFMNGITYLGASILPTTP